MSFYGCIAEVELRERLRLSPVDRFAIRLKPCAHAAENIGFIRNDRTVSVGPNVEDVIAAVTDHFDQSKNVFSLFGLQLSSLLPRAISPGLFEDRSGRFPWLVEYVIGNLVVSHLQEVSLSVPDPAAYQAVRLVLMDDVGKFLALQFGWMTHIEPDLSERSILCHEFF